MPSEPDITECLGAAVASRRGLPCGMVDCCRLKRDPEEDALDALLERALRACDPMRGKETPRMRLTAAELRQAAERRWSYKIRWGLRRLFGLGSHYQPPRKKANQEGGRSG